MRNVVQTHLQGMLSRPIYKECCRNQSTRNVVEKNLQEMLSQHLYKKCCGEQSTRNVVATNLLGMLSKQIYEECHQGKSTMNIVTKKSTRNVVVTHQQGMLLWKIYEKCCHDKSRNVQANIYCWSLVVFSSWSILSLTSPSLVSTPRNLEDCSSRAEHGKINSWTLPRSTCFIFLL